MMFKDHLLYRIAIFDGLAAAALAWGWQQGFVWPMFETDTSGICFMIVGIAILGKISLTRSALKVTRAKNALRAGALTSVKPKGFMAKQENIGDFIQACVLFGLAGTLVGIKFAVAGIDPNAEYSAMIIEVVWGVLVALNTSLVGIAAGLWLGTGWRMLNTATVTMLEDING